MMTHLTTEMPLFPQQYADQFHLFKVIVSAVTSVLLTAHMLERWEDMVCYAQRLRFLILLGYALVSTYYNYEIILHTEPVEPRHVLGLAMTLLLFYATSESIKEYRIGRDVNR